jgi:hypothetical protein
MRVRTLSLLSAAALGLFILAPATLRADDVIFSNFGPGQSYQGASWFDTGNTSMIGNEVNAFAFSPTTTAAVTGAAVPLALLTGSAPTPLNLYIESSASGAPGSILATLTQTGSYSQYPVTTVVDFACTGSCATLDAGSTYWLVDQATDPANTTGWLWSFATDGAWYYNGTGSATGPWTTATNFANDIAAFDVTGTPSTAVPPVSEPASLVLLGSGLLGIVAAARRRTRWL